MRRRKSLAPPPKNVNYETVNASLTEKQRKLLISYQRLLQILEELNQQVVEISKTPASTLAHLRDLELCFAVVHNAVKASIYNVDARNEPRPSSDVCGEH